MHCARLVSKVCIPIDKLIKSMLTSFFGCTAPAKDLDSGYYVCHSQEHAELLGEVFELSTLWDEYGLVGDVVVSVPLLYYLCLFTIF